MLAIMHVLSKFKRYLICGRFTIKIDHNSLSHFLGQKDLNERQQKWVTRVQAYDFDIEYKKGKTNTSTDALSRSLLFYSFLVINADWKVKLIAEYAKNDFTSKLLDGSLVDAKFRIHDGLIFYKNRIFLVPESKLKERVISALHDASFAGHPGFYKTYRIVREKFSWKGLKDDLMKHVRECSTCQKNKSENTLSAGLLQPLPIPGEK